MFYLCGLGTVGACATEPNARVEPASGQLAGPAWESVGSASTPELIAAMGRLSAEPGSLVERTGDDASMTDEDRWQERVAWEIKGRLYEPETATRLDRRLFMRAARRESAGVLTDPTAVRGDLYRSVIGAWVRQGRLSFEEERWARSVVWVDWEAPEALPRMSAVYVRITGLRRLVHDRPVRLRVHDRVYGVRPGPNGGVRIEPVGRRPGERWDGQVRIADFVRWPNMISVEPSEDVLFRGMLFEGDAVADVWWRVGKIERTVPVRIGVDAGVEQIQDDPEIAAWLASLRGVLKWERGPGSARAWPVGVEIEFPQEDVAWPAGFTFGGGVSLEVLWSGRADYEPLASAGMAWWALRDAADRHGRRLIEGRGEWVAFDAGPPEYRGALMAWPADGERLEGARLVIHSVDGGIGRMFGPHWDREAKRVWERSVRIDLTEAQRRALERWMVEGWE